MIDPARVRSPQDKPRVERTVTYMRDSFFAGEEFHDLADAQRRAVDWSRIKAGMRIHGTLRARPAEVFAVEEAGVLLPGPDEVYDTPTWTVAKVHRDHHIQVAKALYSIPGALIGETVDVRVDSRLVKVLFRGQVVKIHPKQPPGRRSTDEADLPSEVTVYAMRDLGKLQARAARHGPAIGTYPTALLDIPLPWTKMRQVYRLLNLVRKFGADRVEQACVRALECEAVDVGLIARIVARAAEDDPAHTGPQRDRRGGTVRPRPRRVRHRRGGGPMTAPTATTITPELKALLRRVKLGKTLDTLPERLILARTSQLSHAEFLELVLADEVARRDRQSATLRARTAKLDPAMTLEAWDGNANITYVSSA